MHTDGRLPNTTLSRNSSSRGIAQIRSTLQISLQIVERGTQKGPSHHLLLSGFDWLVLLFCSMLNSTYALFIQKAYHDVATHNIEDGTGGMDASIFYELDRAEVRVLATWALWIHHLCRLAEHWPSNERFGERLRIYINSICIMCALLNCIAPTHYF